ncbi:DUF402 domain-containing protein [Microaerobacter geothermalis]|uniref:DUF402 domain-containing protein n=1 Tax=Microaerobacter geothermalis TaxID=674972 RepID=UPI001F28C738|nr:DUF402 domain-containing protein [Microaerobacter geothermalis]MCF6094396.1 DUF402 domain-containing protein [Microaerobacter geothermalis]
MTLPKVGQSFRIESYKHSGQFHRSWNETILLQRGRSHLCGGNDQVIVTESDGREWVTREPAICTFSYENWFNTIAMIRNDGVYYYCNIGSPAKWKNGVLFYIDYDLDIKVYPDGSIQLLDEDEFERHRAEMNYPDDIVKKVLHAVDQLMMLIQQRKGPFASGFVDEWYERYIQYAIHNQRE